jgi:hypothetical protein
MEMDIIQIRVANRNRYASNTDSLFVQLICETLRKKFSLKDMQMTKIVKGQSWKSKCSVICSSKPQEGTGGLPAGPHECCGFGGRCRATQRHETGHFILGKDSRKYGLLMIMRNRKYN